MLSQKKIGFVGVAILIFLFGFWFVVPTVKAWRADRLVDELCNKDGGIRVHETVELRSSSAADKLPRVRPKHLKEDSDPFYYVSSTSDILGRNDSQDTAALTVFRIETALHRSSDDKLLAVRVAYVRRGGDPVGPWHPSSYHCPPPATTGDLIRSVLKRA
jgi:hypothetical protein